MTQNEALAIVESGQNVLLTGAAGSGKTYLLREVIRRAKQNGQHVAVTATTGLAATHLSGTTIHAWSGIGIADRIWPNTIRKLPASRKATIQKANLLIIDEISMLHHYRLDMIDQILQIVRESHEPFGGLQVVLCGDFFQLPPVTRYGEPEAEFVTTSDAWREANFTVCYLHQQFRQSGDDEYASLLNAIRAGVVAENHRAVLHAQKPSMLHASTSTRLHTTNADVDSINSLELAKLTTPSHFYSMSHTGKASYVDTLKKSCLAPVSLELKVGAKVMFIKNSQDKKYVNGSLGEVTGFESSPSQYPIVKLSSGQSVTASPDVWELIDGDTKRASLTQLPLRLAWAITVHKSQGMTLDGAQVDLKNAFVAGMGYVALSRVRSLDTLALDGFNELALQVSAKATALEQELQALSSTAIEQNSRVFALWQKNEKTRKPAPPEPKKPESAKSGWSEKLEKMRQDYPNAYRPWTSEQDTKLKELFALKTSIKNISSELGRHPGSIRSRLVKHYGEEAEESV